MEMKSRLLLPESQDPETDSEVQNPRGSYTNVIQQLLEYKHIKEAAERLEAQAEAYHTRYSRWDDKAPAESPPSHAVRIHPVELWDLIAAFARILREIQPAETPSIQMDDVPQQVYEKEIIQLLKRTSPIKFIDIFQPPYVRLRLIGIFLALLELIRRCLVEVSNDHEGTIFLSLKEPEKQGA
jgi:segregation and condensation protein A